MSFSKIFQILFIVGPTFIFLIPEYLNNSWWCFSSSFSDFEDRRRFFFQPCSILFKIRDSSLLPSSHNCFRCDNSFHPSGAIQESFQFDSLELIISELFILSFQLSFSKSYRCIAHIISIQFMISSFSSKFSHVSSFFC